MANTQQHIKYRKDIDGLRGLAVLLVIVFHAFPEALPGGFIGVDIFFVISGYLITSIISENLKHNKFSFLEFYIRRIKRIFPALLLVLVACYAMGWFTLLPHEYQQLGKHIAAGAVFISNFILWNEAGYFDNAAISKPLLHLWSLGIEEQFYIFWPIILWVIFKCRLSVLALIATIATISFAMNCWLVYQDATAAFYSPLTRIWELLVGAFIAQKRNTGYSQFLGMRMISALSILSGGVIVVSAFVISKNSYFPGVWALLPTVATAILIALGSSSQLNRSFLSSPLLVWVGLISFPLYLWHWPLLSFGRILEGEPLGAFARAIILLISVALAWATYQWVERPIRSDARCGTKALCLIVLMALVGYCGLNVYLRDGLGFRGPQIIGKDKGYDGGPGGTMVWACGLPPEISSSFTCWQDTRPQLKFALVGDSKASALHGGVVRTSSADGRWLFIGMGSKASPLPIITSDALYAQYQYGSTTAIRSIADNKQIEVVVIAAATRALFRLKNHTDIEDLEASPNYQVALDGLQRVVDVLKASKKKVVFLIDNPTLPHPEDCLPRITTSEVLNRLLRQTMNQRCRLPLDRHLELSRKYRVLLNTLEENNKGVVSLFDTIPILCSTSENSCSTIKNGRLLYGETDHISDHAAGLIGKDLNAYLHSLLR